MTIVWERAAHLVYRIWFLFLFVILVVCNFDFEDGTVVLVEAVPGHCSPFTCVTFRIFGILTTAVGVNNCCCRPSIVASLTGIKSSASSRLS